MPGVTTTIVAPEEAGQKLDAFVRRRVGERLPRSLLMRWIRKGHVRVDGKRAKPFQRVREGQSVRIPPHDDPAPDTPVSAENVLIVARADGLLALLKPAGLPVHGGSGHQDSLHGRLQAQFPDSPFPPTPAHRLDKDTSGLLLAATTHARLRELHALFRERAVKKYYLAWVEGLWPHAKPELLADRMEKQGEPGRERVLTGEGKEARAEAAPLFRDKNKSLLLIRLITGRTHQIRVQLSGRGHAIVGDPKYGQKHPSGRLFLHSWKIILGDAEFTAAPDWEGEYAVCGEWLPMAGTDRN